MLTARQHKINTYAAGLSHIAYTTIHNEEIFKDVNNCIELYKERTTANPKLTMVYKSAFNQTKLEITIRQKKIEVDYYLEVLKRSCNKTEYKYQLLNSMIYQQKNHAMS